MVEEACPTHRWGSWRSARPSFSWPPARRSQLARSGRSTDRSSAVRGGELMPKVKNMKTRCICLAILTATVAVSLAPNANAEGRVSPNYRLNNDSAPFRGQDQPGLAVDPTNPNHVVAVDANYLDSTCEASVSTNAGSTWSPAITLRPPTGQDFVQFCSNTVGTNQIVDFGTNNTVYTAVSAQKQGAGFLQDAAALLYKSTDGGVTWQEGTVAMAGGPGGLDPNATAGPAFYRPS